MNSLDMEEIIHLEISTFGYEFLISFIKFIESVFRGRCFKNKNLICW